MPCLQSACATMLANLTAHIIKMQHAYTLMLANLTAQIIKMQHAYTSMLADLTVFFISQQHQQGRAGKGKDENSATCRAAAEHKTSHRKLVTKHATTEAACHMQPLTVDDVISTVKSLISCGSKVRPKAPLLQQTSHCSQRLTNRLQLV